MKVNCIGDLIIFQECQECLKRQSGDCTVIGEWIFKKAVVSTGGELSNEKAGN
jgi:hypothetical protein